MKGILILIGNSPSTDIKNIEGTGNPKKKGKA